MLAEGGGEPGFYHKPSEIYHVILRFENVDKITRQAWITKIQWQYLRWKRQVEPAHHACQRCIGAGC
jgi:hypothetical protein